MSINPNEITWDEQSDTPSIKDVKWDGEDTSMEWRDVFTQAVKNTPSSAKETGKNMIAPFIHPIETAKTLGKVAFGGGEKLVEGTQENEKYFDAMVDHFSGRYGSVDGFKNAVAKDPVGVLTDVASFFTGAGTAVKGAATLGKLEKVADVAGAVAKGAARLDPYNIVKAGVALPAKAISSAVPEKMYQSAVKFATTLPIKEREAITKTALKAENQIMPTVEGMEKLRDKIGVLNSQVEGLLSPQNLGFHVEDVSKLRKGLDDLKENMLFTTDRPLVVHEAFDTVYKELDEMERLRTTRTPIEIQRTKQNIYKDLETIYEQHNNAPAQSKVRIAVAKNAREILEDIVPEIKDLNKKEGALIDLWDAVESKANRISNRDLIGIGPMIKVASGAAGGYAIAGEVGAKIGTGLALAHGILDSPVVKAKMAIVLSRLKQQGIQVRPTAAAVRLGLYQTEKSSGKKPKNNMQDVPQTPSSDDETY